MAAIGWQKMGQIYGSFQENIISEESAAIPAIAILTVYFLKPGWSLVSEQKHAENQVILCLRLDAGTQIGFGHLSRSLAFARQFRPTELRLYTRTPRAVAIFLDGEPDLVLIEIPSEVSVPHEAEWIMEHTNSVQIPLVYLLDHYCIDAEYEAVLQEREAILVTFDDFGTRFVASDYVISPAHPGYPPGQLQPYTIACTGLEYSILASDFVPRGARANGNSILVLAGGGDATNLLPDLLESLSKNQDLHGFQLVVPGQIREEVRSMFPAVEFPGKINSAGIAARMEASRFVICSASTVALEASVVGVPVLAIVTAENQRMLAQALERAGVALVKYDDITSLCATIRSMLAGEGTVIQRAQREVMFDRACKQKNLFANLLADTQLQLREAVPDDIALYFGWANDPEVRAASLQTSEIQWGQHVSWFRERIAGDAAWLFVGMIQDQAIGQIRFERLEENQILLSYSVDASMRGLGYGKLLVRKGMKRLMSVLSEAEGYSKIDWQVVARVRSRNVASQRIFRHLGFLENVPEDPGSSYTFFRTVVFKT